MNIHFFLTPKVNVGFVYSSDTVAEAVEKMLRYGFTTVPVINEISGQASEVHQQKTGLRRGQS